MQRYSVHFVSDDALPAEVDFTFARQEGRTFLFIRQSSINVATGCCDVLARAWATWQSAEFQETACAV